MARFLKYGGPVAYQPSKRPIVPPEAPEATVGDTAAVLTKTASSAVSFYNTLQKNKLDSTPLFTDESFTYFKNDFDSSLPADGDRLNIFQVDPNQKGISQFTNKWSDRVRINPSFIEDSLNADKSRYEIYKGLNDKLTSQDFSPGDIENILSSSGETAIFTEEGSKKRYKRNQGEGLDDVHETITGSELGRMEKEHQLRQVYEQDILPTTPDALGKRYGQVDGKNLTSLGVDVETEAEWDTELQRIDKEKKLQKEIKEMQPDRLSIYDSEHYIPKENDPEFFDEDIVYGKTAMDDDYLEWFENTNQPGSKNNPLDSDFRRFKDKGHGPFSREAISDYEDTGGRRTSLRKSYDKEVEDKAYLERIAKHKQEELDWKFIDENAGQVINNYETMFWEGKEGDGGPGVLSGRRDSKQLIDKYGTRDPAELKKLLSTDIKLKELRPKKVDVVDPSKIKREGAYNLNDLNIERMPENVYIEEHIKGHRAGEPDIRAKKIKAWEDHKNKQLHLREFKKNPNYKPGDLPKYSVDNLSDETKKALNTHLFQDEYKTPGVDVPDIGIQDVDIEGTFMKGFKDPSSDAGVIVNPKTGKPLSYANVGDISNEGITKGEFDKSKKSGFLKNLGTDKGFFKNIGKGSVKDTWKGSKPGKILEAFKGIGKGGFKDLAKGSDLAKYGKAIANIGKGGLKSLTAAAVPATATTAGVAAGPLAAMGPAGWTMMALSLLGPKLFDKKTFMGKIFSDPCLKENIKIVGKSPSGINVYEYDYKNVEGRYRGVLANEVPWASSHDEHGHLMVDYSKVDVDFIKVK